jgi:hypothetical protein
MAIFSLADITICVTLLVNATALISGKFPPIIESSEDGNDDRNIEGVGVRINQLVRQIRSFSCILIVWNVFLLALMIVAFE